ncbi:septal ring lytic transglycosylase RlpA family protein [Candidatus Azambacteria bacterium]|nr:septal ring lytic transglycosylase RlpA family protein [Candidatus Azambacteria bacterium]
MKNAKKTARKSVIGILLFLIVFSSGSVTALLMSERLAKTSIPTIAPSVIPNASPIPGALVAERVTPLPTPPAAEEKSEVKTVKVKTYYMVQPYDSINGIAAKYGVLPWQLREVNGMKPGVIIHPLQKLVIPDVKWKSRKYIGKASWYGGRDNGKPMANAEIFNQHEILIAHRTLPFGTKVRVTNLINSTSIVTIVKDRGPYPQKNEKYTREIDLSYGAAKALGAVKAGVIPVEITILS